jgi:succinate-semialdehyde dehydrogenase/glutarate-semialdehyde dehydrogenase
MYEKLGQFIDGKWCQSSDKKTYDVINPATEEIIGQASKATSEDVKRALKSAEKGLIVWKKTPPWQRSNILRKIADTIRDKKDILAKWMTLENGKPLAEGAAEANGTADIFEWNAEETKRIYGQTIESRFEDTRVHVYYQPVGVVAALSPWNFPLILAARKISTALGAGCSVIIKPDTITPGVVMQLVDICRECGVPPGAVNLLSGDPPSIASQLIQSDIVKKISITGSVRVGKLILKQAADKVQRVTMELSGHSPFIVFDDADIKKAADMAISAKFRNNGQVCISPNRFYIHEKKKDEFVNLFIEKTKKLKIGNGMDPDTHLGPLTTQKRLNEVEADFTIMKEEPFGPLVPMLSFKSFDEVIERANNHELGLCSYVCTNSMETAHLASEQLETGSVAVNTGFVAIAEAPFGGIKQSGYGREGGSMAIKDYLNVKYTHMGIKG